MNSLNLYIVLEQGPRILLTKELCEDTSEEIQVARNIICHGRRKWLHYRVNAEDPLKKLLKNKKGMALEKGEDIGQY